MILILIGDNRIVKKEQWLHQEDINGYRRYEVDTRGFSLDLCDVVEPETVVGHECSSGNPVKAGLSGRIATVYYNPMNDSFIVLAVAREVD